MCCTVPEKIKIYMKFRYKHVNKHMHLRDDCRHYHCTETACVISLLSITCNVSSPLRNTMGKMQFWPCTVGNIGNFWLLQNPDCIQRRRRENVAAQVLFQLIQAVTLDSFLSASDVYSRLQYSLRCCCCCCWQDLAQKKSFYAYNGLHVSTCLSFNTFQHVSTRSNKFTTTLDKFQHI